MKHTYTVFCKLPDTPRGQYDEEIDVKISGRRSETAAKQAAQREIDKDYDPRLRPVRVVHRPAGYWF